MLDFFNKKEQFIASIEYTTSRHEFTANLIEKDYLCSLILMHIYSNINTPLVFKGGTLLSKSHADFNRLSEDLDFAIPMPITATRNQRSKNIKPTKELLQSIPKDLSIFTISQPLLGHNNSSQYTMALGYQSKITQLTGKILIDIGMRDELLAPAQNIDARTLIMDPFLNTNVVYPIKITGLSKLEAYAEKTRAALCRKQLAIRDFYDLDFAEQNKLIDFNDPVFIDLISKKIKFESFLHDFNDENVISFLRSKIKPELLPTLKISRADSFNLERIINKLVDLSVKINRISLA